MPQLDIDQAILNPASVFSEPEAIIDFPQLTTDQKIAALRQWAYDAREIKVAEEEGMVSNGEDLLQRILIALGHLGYPVNTDHTAPSKQHPFTD